MGGRTEELLIGLKEIPKWSLRKRLYGMVVVVVRLLGGGLSGGRRNEQGSCSSETGRAIMWPAWRCRRGRERPLVNFVF